MHVEKLKPCPFCGGTPEYPHGKGTQYDLECDCGMASSCVQICDLMTIEERMQDGAWSDEGVCYAPEFVERAKQHVTTQWNKRFNTGE